MKTGRYEAAIIVWNDGKKQVVSMRKKQRNPKHSDWVDPWTLQGIFDDWYENVYPFVSSFESDETISKFEYEIDMAINDIELLYEVTRL